MDENDAVFFDADDHWVSFNAAVDDLPEPSASVSSVSDPHPALPEPRISHPQPPSPASTLRRRKTRRVSHGKEPEHSPFDSSLASESSDFIDVERTNFRNHIIRQTPNEDENPSEKLDSNEAQAQHASAVTEEEKTEESTVTTAAKDDAGGDSAASASQPGDSSSSSLELVAGLVIKAIGFQIKLIAMFVTYPMLFAFHGWMFCVDPLGTARKGKVFVIRVLARARGAVFGCIEPHVKGLFSENDSAWSVAFRCGWGLLWSIYVCCVLSGLLVNSFLLSGFLMKCFLEKPVRMREVLNFDYTKHSPVAYAPIISCDGVVFGGKDSENNNNNNVGVWKWRGERVIPYKHKVQVTISLTVPESGYNRDLGVFQARVDFLSYNGKTIASSSQPCMLRFRSEPIRLIMTFLKIAPLVTGYTSETQTLNVKMRGFVEGDQPTSCLKVTLEQRAEFQPGAGIPQIYDASLVVESKLPFFKRIIWLWKMSIFVWITMMAFVMQLLFVLVCCRSMIIPRTRRQGVASARHPAIQNNLQVQS